MEEYSFNGRIQSLTLESVRLDTLLPGEEEERNLMAKIYYDEEGRPLRKVEKTGTTLFDYDAEGNCVKETLLNPEGRVMKENHILYNLDRRISEENDLEKKTFHYNNKGLVDYATSFVNGIQESVTSFHYDDQNRLMQREIRDPEGHLLRSCRYSRNDRGLIEEETIINQENILLEQNVYKYTVFHEGNWLKRFRSVREKDGKEIPVEILYRGLSLSSASSVPEPPENPEPTPKKGPPVLQDREVPVRTLDFENGSYTGPVDQEGRPQGKGLFTGRDGSRYEGDFEDGRMNGRGDLITAEGRHYSGEFSRNLPHGEGECLWPDGSRYTGSFRQGEMHGIGVFHWADGSRFTGLFDKNRATEQGLYENPSEGEEEP